MIDQTVILTQPEFDALLEYSYSLPTGTTIGKRWKARKGDRWYLGEYTRHLPIPTCCRYHRCISGWVDGPCLSNNFIPTPYDPAHPENWKEPPNQLVEIQWALILVAAEREELPVHLL